MGILLELSALLGCPLNAENTFPAVLIDALAGYRYLVETLGFKATNVVVSGDSVGGHLAFMLVWYLTQEAIPSLPSPGAAILLSPTVNWGCTHDANPGSSMTCNACSDIVQVILQSGYMACAVELCSALGWDLDFLRPSSYVSCARPVGTSSYYWFPESWESGSHGRPAGLTLFRF